MYLIGVPAAFVTALVFHWPVYICLLCTKAEQFIKAIILTRRFLSRKWLNNVIKGVK